MDTPKTKFLMTPLAIISAFVSLVEVTLTVGIIQTTGNVQLILTWFAVLFPVLIATCFFTMLWFRPYHLYAPTEYSQSTSAHEFVEAITKNRQTPEKSISALGDSKPTTISKDNSSQESVPARTRERDDVTERLLSGILNSQHRIYILEKMVEWILSNNTAFVKNLTPEVMEKFRSEALDDVRGLREGF